MVHPIPIIAGVAVLALILFFYLYKRNMQSESFDKMVNEATEPKDFSTPTTGDLIGELQQDQDDLKHRRDDNLDAILDKDKDNKEITEALGDTPEKE